MTNMIVSLWAWIACGIDSAAWFAPSADKSRLYVKPYFALDGKLHTQGLRVTIGAARVLTMHYQDGESGARSLPFRHSTRFPRLSAWRRGRFLLSAGYAVVTER